MKFIASEGFVLDVCKDLRVDNCMRVIFLVFISMLTIGASAQMQVLPFSVNSGYGAIFPCKAEKKSVNSNIGVTNALQCRVDSGSGVCVFLISEQSLDLHAFKNFGFEYVREVHRQYALQMDAHYKKIHEKVVENNSFGKVLMYELVRSQEGLPVNVKGAWMVSNDRLLRGAVSCAPNGTGFMKNESTLFFQSFSVIR